MTVSRDKIIKQAQEIADGGCERMSCCLDCELHGKICRGRGFVDYDDAKHVAYAFLAGISFEKGLI